MNKELQNNDYLNTLVALKERILQAQYRSYSAVNSEMILAYLDVGKIISEKTKIGWGTSVIKQLSIDLQSEFVGVKGFSERNLRRMRFIYEEMQVDSIWPQAVAKLHWGHTTLIFSKLKTKSEREFYLSKTQKEAWSRSVLEEKIKADTYSLHQNFQNNFEKSLTKHEVAKYSMQFKDEYDLSFLNLPDHHSEQQLENGIVKNITKMLGQFGADFAFMGQQFRLELDDKEYFIDLLFYHRKLKSMIAIELKIDEFKPEYSQQLNWYLHLLDKTVKYSEDNTSIGILLCKSKSEITVEYALEIVNKPIGVATYTYTQLPEHIAKNLPDEEQFKRIFGEPF
ncbi:MAG: PDDEXK nuclease domain-containing protein [Bacteroidales bacterium]|nr:PDDEXK nuclease domain-containing protein [Bacteroidales bacterium]